MTAILQPTPTLRPALGPKRPVSREENKPPSLRIHEIFHSIQGESTHAGLPCTFIRLTGCHLRCTYCDTAHAFYQGDRITLDDIVEQVYQISGACRLVEVTGGEPLLQPNVHPLMSRLCDEGFKVLIETSGACDISTCDPRILRIMDLKTPGSGESHRNMFDNINHLNDRDEVKFVLTDRRDYEWARDIIEKHALADRTHAILLSAVQPPPPADGDPEAPPVQALSLQSLAQWVLEDHLPVRLQTQLHKLIWHPSTRGV